MKMYKYETHLHTAEGSACASASGADMARAHKALGYDGIFVTDHFFNANTAVPKGLNWAERVDRLWLGYEHAKQVGDEIGLKVWFGFEYTTKYGADFLIYNTDKEFMKQNEYLLICEDEKVCFRAIRDMGGFVVHAHPFRLYNYIHHINLYPDDVDAVETINGSHPHNSMFNRRADLYADMYGLIKTGGSDSHHLDKLFGSGIAVPKPINCPEDYLRMLKDGEVIPLERTLP